jgi:hypothetical protein
MISQLNDQHWEADYDRLLNLTQEQSIVCSLDYRYQGDPEEQACRDIAKTSYRPKNQSDEEGDDGFFEVRARGIGYIGAWSAEKFKAGCAKVNLRYLRPKPLRDAELEKAQALLDLMVVGTAWRTKEGMSPDERYDRVWLSVSWLQESVIFDFTAMTADGESWVEWALEDLTADFFQAHDSWEPDPESLVSTEKSTKEEIDHE